VTHHWRNSRLGHLTGKGLFLHHLLEFGSSALLDYLKLTLLDTDLQHAKHMTLNRHLCLHFSIGCGKLQAQMRCGRLPAEGGGNDLGTSAGERAGEYYLLCCSRDVYEAAAARMPPREVGHVHVPRFIYLQPVPGQQQCEPLLCCKLLLSPKQSPVVDGGPLTLPNDSLKQGGV